MEEHRSSVDAVGEDVAQFGEHSSDEPQQRHGAMIVLNVGGLNKHGEQRAFGIGDDVTLAAFDLLGHVKPTRTAAFRGFRALAVDDASRWDRFTPDGLACQPDEAAVDAMPSPVVAPAIEVALHGRARRKVLGQRPPLAAGRENIENGIYQRAQIGRSRAANSSRFWHQRFQKHPFAISRIACKAKPVAPILQASDFGPRHRALPRISQIRWNHMRLKSLTSFSASLSGPNTPASLAKRGRIGMPITPQPQDKELAYADLIYAIDHQAEWSSRWRGIMIGLLLPGAAPFAA